LAVEKFATDTKLNFKLCLTSDAQISLQLKFLHFQRRSKSKYMTL